MRDAEICARAVVDALERPESEAEALRSYESTRDHLSMELMETTDQIARYDWTLSEVQELHKQLSRSMKAENEYLADLDTELVSRNG